MMEQETSQALGASRLKIKREKMERKMNKRAGLRAAKREAARAAVVEWEYF